MYGRVILWWAWQWVCCGGVLTHWRGVYFLLYLVLEEPGGSTRQVNKRKHSVEDNVHKHYIPPGDCVRGRERGREMSVNWF